MATPMETLINSILVQLGESKVVVEIGATEVTTLINQAIVKIAPYVQDTSLVTLEASPVINMTAMGVIDVVRVLESPSYGTNGVYDIDLFRTRIMNPSVNSLVMSRQISEVDAMIDKSFKFDAGNLYLDDYRGKITVEVIKSVGYDSLEDERARSWVDSYALALAKITVGRIRSKIKMPNAPIELDGETLLQEGTTEKQDLESQLNERDFGFFFVTR